MPGINEFMTLEHRRCDDILANAESVVDRGDWERTEKLTNEFIAEMRRHFNMEEQVLFPAVEERTGIVNGPTVIMRQEHEQIRGLLMQLQWALEAKHKEDYLDTSETLLIMMQQHNMKEEGMLYPMSDEQLGPDADQILNRMQEIET